MTSSLNIMMSRVDSADDLPANEMEVNEGLDRQNHEYASRIILEKEEINFSSSRKAKPTGRVKH